MKVFEASEKILLYLREHQILAAYKKAKAKIQEGHYQEVQLKSDNQNSKIFTSSESQENTVLLQSKKMAH